MLLLHWLSLDAFLFQFGSIFYWLQLDRIFFLVLSDSGFFLLFVSLSLLRSGGVVISGCVMYLLSSLFWPSHALGWMPMSGIHQAGIWLLLGEFWQWVFTCLQLLFVLYLN